MSSENSSDLISALERKVAELEKKHETHHNILYQFIGGLYNQQTQGDMIDSYLNLLFDMNKKENDLSKVNIWPTTRQGDKNEGRLNMLEKEIDKLVFQQKWKVVDVKRAHGTSLEDLLNIKKIVGEHAGINVGI